MLLQLPTLLLAGLLALETQNGSHADTPLASATVIHVGEPKLSGVKRLGINLSGQTYYDSGQMLRNLVFRNPGFEGETWQSILRCKQATPTSCTDANQYTVWPADFLKDAHFDILTGTAKGLSGTITASSAPSGSGVTLTFPALSTPLAPGDLLIVRIKKPGDPTAGWWTEKRNEASFTPEYKDLAPTSPGKQALRISASGPGQSASISSYFDSTATRSFLHLHGTCRLTFRAKAISGNRDIQILFQRLDLTHGTHIFFDNTVALGPNWADYAFDIPADDLPNALGTLALTFRLASSSALLDDVSLTPAASTLTNPTAFRDEVLSALQDLHPGILRYMDNGTDFGSSLDNMLALPFARQRDGYSTQSVQQGDIPIGLHEFLVLCQAVGAEPWYTLPAGTSPTEARNLIEYLAGPATSPYGSIRANLGQPAPWTFVFPTIHLELGNEQWNSGSFYGATIPDPAAYGQRAADVFTAARSNPAFDPTRFDLILGAWAANDWWTSQQLAHSAAFDSTAVAPYLFSTFNDASSTESIFGPMLAQPEQYDSTPSGLIARQLEAARHASPHPALLSVYEVNLGTMSGSVPQSAIDQAIPSLGAGLATIDHMLLMLRDLGITNQALFALPEFANAFTTPSGQPQTTPLWGAVVDMGNTNLRRPTFLAEQLANQAILPTLLATTLTGQNPTWTQPKSPNDNIQLPAAHLIQTFAFADDPAHDTGHRSLILLNLSRTDTLPVTFTGVTVPLGQNLTPITQSRLTAPHITDNNETHPNVKIERSILPTLDPKAPYLLPPFSMTVLTWQQPTTH